MKIIYDFNERDPLKKCYAENEDGLRLINFGCFHIKVEETKDGKASFQHEVKRWGDAKKRREIHKKVSDQIGG